MAVEKTSRICPKVPSSQEHVLSGMCHTRIMFSQGHVIRGTCSLRDMGFEISDLAPSDFSKSLNFEGSMRRWSDQVQSSNP